MVLPWVQFQEKPRILHFLMSVLAAQFLAMESQAQCKILLARIMILPALNKRGGYKWSRPVIKQLFYHTTFRVPTEASYRAR